MDVQPERSPWLEIRTPAGTKVAFSTRGDLSTTVPVTSNTEASLGLGAAPRSIEYSVRNTNELTQLRAINWHEDFFFSATQTIATVYQAKPWVGDALAAAAMVVPIAKLGLLSKSIIEWLLEALAAFGTSDSLPSGAGDNAAAAETPANVDGVADPALATAIDTAMGPGFSDYCEIVPLCVPDDAYAGQSIDLQGHGFSPGGLVSLVIGVAECESPTVTCQVPVGEDGTFSAGCILPIHAGAGQYLVLVPDEAQIDSSLRSYLGDTRTELPRFRVGAALLTVLADTAPPTTTVSLQPSHPNGLEGWYTSPVVVSLEAYDAQSGVAETLARVDAEEWLRYSEPLSLTDGQHSIEFCSIDLAGNTEEVSRKQVSVDTCSPLISYSGPTGWSSRPIDVGVVANDRTSGIAAVYLVPREGETLQEEATTLRVHLDEESWYDLRMWAIDVAGNVSISLTACLGLDFTPPQIEVLPTRPPNEHGWYNSPVAVSFAAVDPPLADGHPGSGLAEVSPESSVSTEGLGLEVFGSAADLAGNRAIASLSLNLDMTKPTLALVFPERDLFTDDSVLCYEVQAHDALSGIEAWNVMLDGSVCSENTIDLWTLPLGQHAMTVTAQDVAGNVSSLTKEFVTTTTIESLISLKHTFLQRGWLGTAPGCARSLDAKLESALRAAKQGRRKTFDNVLEAFIHEVEALREVHIWGPAADTLIRDARYLQGNGAGL